MAAQAHLHPQVRVGVQLQYRVTRRVRVVERDDEAGVRRLHQVNGERQRGGHHGDGAAHVLGDLRGHRVAEVLLVLEQGQAAMEPSTRRRASAFGTKPW